jgi:prepilin-type N-terminal cleavage/methylation domain-containing protein
MTRGAAEEGFTLVELLVAMAVLVAVMAIVAPFLSATFRAQPDVTERARNVTDARLVTERLTREIRQGVSIETATPSQLVIRTYTRRAVCGGTAQLPSSSPATVCQVTYSCASGACTRREAAEDGTNPGPAVTVTRDLSSSNIFTYTPAVNPTYVGISLVLPNPEGAGSVTLQNGASLRNATLSY